MKHFIAIAHADRFAGWPANNGLMWNWEGREFLVGCSLGEFHVLPGHNIAGRIDSVLLRSRDGGETWSTERPAGYMADQDALADLPAPLDFSAPGFVLRVFGIGYHASEQKRGGFYVSADRGVSWRGPFRFHGIAGCAELSALGDLEMTPRTDYIVYGPRDCLVFLSARNRDAWGADRVFVARTSDGGLSFRFVAWMVPPSDPYRAVMPSTVRCSANTLVSAVRRRQMGTDRCWIDAYVSTDDGASWSCLGKVGDTGAENGNPPALASLRDGRLCCVYGNRTRRQMLARISADEGRTWGDELVVRAGFESLDEDADFGYPRLAQRADGQLVAAYYWATREHPQQHIAVTVWHPDSL
jgi:hypothetical protein